MVSAGGSDDELITAAAWRGETPSHQRLGGSYLYSYRTVSDTIMNDLAPIYTYSLLHTPCPVSSLRYLARTYHFPD